MKLFVFASSRKIRAYYENLSTKNALLDEAMSVQDFLNKILLSPYRRASDYERLLLMQKSCKQSKNSQKLHINENFFAFLKNHEYLFSFFKELSLEKKSILDLQNNDYYAQYNEHLEILDEILKNYLLGLKQNELYDEISLSFNYELNTHFLNSFDEIVFDLQGFLSAFEKDILKQISTVTKLVLCFDTSVFNQDFLNELLMKLECSHISLKLHHHYELALHEKSIQKEEAFFGKNPKVELKNFELASLQVAFVYDKISSFLRAGLKPKEIVVITPDESFCELLKAYDKLNMLNFAKGNSLIQSFFYKKLKALYDAANEESFVYNENSLYFEDEDTKFDLHNSLLKYLEIKCFKEFKQQFEKKEIWQYFYDLIQHFLKEENEELQSLIKQELLFLKQLNKDHKLTLKELFELFFMKINSLNLSSVGGGEVTVMGLLESRGLEFKGVIIVDFNDDLIPKRSVNELFLNNEVRARAGLISYEKRENLQRFYYERLIKNAEKVAISYVENEEKIPSRLLDELDIRQVLDRTYSNKAYIKALSFDYEPAKIDLVPIKAPVLKHNIFKNSLSFTRLKTFLEQKRTYYYKYILELKEARALSLTSNAFEKGTLIHELLEQYYEAHARHFDYEQFTHLLDEKANCISRLDKELLKIQFKHFAKYENEHFKQGFCIIELEKDIRANYEFKGLSIDINGKIDRIDESKDMILIIDYKSGKVPDNSYQLAFYQALFKATYKKDAKAVYYDLSKTMSFTEGEKTKSLEELENELINLSKLNQPISFENKKTNFCPYAALYEKDLK
ncbi:PD-(D/E)XK nuclease family protein [Campylobacter sp. MIT 97-5078]|uniref:PD-(D/E)XK nuclease family protein n=2 Tax=Campylobacter sp. MIT 97-5078 TaxID=1548153 RepID=UPI0005144D38|nr:PD-(D/E)XK nuclease family protein [Campylobacter sp. MIT 97-5078]KGI57658.1 hypothetical protein LR59_02940 [Campylobacter sp. MIT 97-5078]TQR26876.1 PD-(D/E)XK nuclease family protein [Campylobacter sp. MIT 97-5078]